jgi:hypothetical protein
LILPCISLLSAGIIGVYHHSQHKLTLCPNIKEREVAMV